MKIRGGVLALIFLLTTSWSQAWSQEGHQMVALLAWERLTPKAKAEAVGLLQHHPYEDVRDLWAASFWPDLLREDPAYHRPQWHYTNRPHFIGVPPKPVEVPKGILWALNHNTRILKDQKAPEGERAVALSWVVHLIGDIHQPLHASTTYSPLFPEGDRGGTRYLVLWKGREIDLHRFWDRAGGLLDGVDRRLSLDEIQEIASKLHDAVLQEPEKVKIRDPKAWVDESYTIVAHTVYDGVTPLDELSLDYIEDSKRISRERLLLAGWRLADYLNRVFE